MLIPLDASRMKVSRATQHADDLARSFDRFLAEKCITAVVEVDTDAGFRTAWVKARVKQGLPFIFAAIIGDCVHNMRVALDYLACDLVRLYRTSGTSLSGVYYPFCNNKNDFKERLQQCRLHRMPTPILQLLDQTAPWRGGNEGLRALHDLDVFDKHQALLPALSVGHVPFSRILSDEHNNTNKHWSTIIDTDGQLLIGLPASLAQPHGTEIECKFTLIFGKDSPSEGRPVLQDLRHMRDGVSRIIDAFAAVIDQTPPGTLPRHP